MVRQTDILIKTYRECKHRNRHHIAIMSFSLQIILMLCDTTTSVGCIYKLLVAYLKWFSTSIFYIILYYIHLVYIIYFHFIIMFILLFFFMFLHTFFVSIFLLELLFIRFTINDIIYYFVSWCRLKFDLMFFSPFPMHEGQRFIIFASSAVYVCAKPALLVQEKPHRRKLVDSCTTLPQIIQMLHFRCVIPAL